MGKHIKINIATGYIVVYAETGALTNLITIPIYWPIESCTLLDDSSRVITRVIDGKASYQKYPASHHVEDQS